MISKFSNRCITKLTYYEPTFTDKVLRDSNLIPNTTATHTITLLYLPEGKGARGTKGGSNVA